MCVCVCVCVPVCMGACPCVSVNLCVVCVRGVRVHVMCIIICAHPCVLVMCVCMCVGVHVCARACTPPDLGPFILQSRRQSRKEEPILVVIRYHDD